MEIKGEDGSKITLQNGTEMVFGRGSGFKANDRAVSRRHILFVLKTPADETDTPTGTRVSFQVLGKNPVFIGKGGGGGKEIKAFRQFQSGDLAIGDWFCVSIRAPLWFTLKRIEGQRDKDPEIQNESSQTFEEIGVSKVDPVKEFGFLVMGHEFDCYPKHRIRDAKNWKWFLEEIRPDSDDDGGGGAHGEVESSLRDRLDGKDKRGGRRKRKKSRDNEDDNDDEWTGESGDDNEVVAKLRKVARPRYSTRSKDPIKPSKSSNQRNPIPAQKRRSEEDIEEEDVDDETLGGFIVDENEEEQLEESDQEEEEFIEDDDGDEELDE